MHCENPFCMVKPVARALPLHEKRHATCLLRIVARRHTLEKRAMQPIFFHCQLHICCDCASYQVNTTIL